MECKQYPIVKLRDGCKNKTHIVDTREKIF